MTTSQKLEYSREARLWLRDFLLPLGIAAFAALRSEEVRNYISNELQKIKYKTVYHD